MRLNIVKRTVMATALVVARAWRALAVRRRRLRSDNDLVLAIYGNNTEALYNLGTHSTLLAAGSGTPASYGYNGIGAGQVGSQRSQVDHLGWDLSLPDGEIHAATSFSPAQIMGALDFTSQFNPSTAWPVGSAAIPLASAPML